MRGKSGFTLIEVVAAMAIIAVIMTALFTMITTVSRSWEASQRRDEALRQLQRVVLSQWYDMSQLVIYSSALPIFPTPLVIESGKGDVYLVNRGWYNPFGEQRSNLQVIHYAMQDKRLLRSTTPFNIAGGSPSISDISALKSRGVGDLSAWQTQLITEKGAILPLWPMEMSALSKQSDVRILALNFTIDALGAIELHVPLPEVVHNASP